MNFLLQNSALAWLLGLAALPLLAHLVARARPPAYRFSDTAFLARVVSHAARVRRPKDWLLLALRTAAVAALIVAFLLPTLFSPDAALPGERRAAVLLVDRSGSMAAREDAGIRFENAIAAASDYLNNAHPDVANIVWMDSDPSSVFPEPGPNLPMLREELRRANSRPEACALKGAFDLALRQLAGVQGHRELVVISDFRASAWKDFEPSIPAGVKVIMRPVAKATPPNLAVTGLSAQPAAPVAGRPITVLARVKNFSGEARRTTLTLDAGGAVQTQPVEVPAYGEADTAFTVRIASAGILPVTAALESDAFPDDDRRHLALEVRETLRLGVVGPPDSPESRTLARFASALGWMEIVPMPEPDATRPVDFLIAPAWAGAKPGELAKIAGGGAPVFVRPASGTPYAALIAAGLPVSGAAGAVVPATEKGAGLAVATRAGTGVFTLFEGGEYGDPVSGRFRERIRFADADLAPAGRVLAAYADGVPALVAAPAGRAPVVLMNLSLDPAKTDWPARGEFVPAFAELLMRSRPESIASSREQAAGSRLAWSPGAGRPGAVTLLDAAGKVRVPESSPGRDGPVWRDTERARPGLYRWRVSERVESCSAVNFPDGVSDLRPLAAPPVAGVVAGSADSLVREAELGRGVPVWPWFLAAAMAFLFLESLICGLGAASSGARER